jgi:hypothetical protein
MLDARHLGDFRRLRIHIVDYIVHLQVGESFLVLRTEMASEIHLQIPIGAVPPVIVDIEFGLQGWAY